MYDGCKNVANLICQHILEDRPTSSILCLQSATAFAGSLVWFRSVFC